MVTKKHDRSGICNTGATTLSHELSSANVAESIRGYNIEGDLHYACLGMY